MAGRAIGLDIGTWAVRAAEIAYNGDSPRVLRFGQLTLPPGAVRHGEVVDVDIVTATLRRLWDQVGFRSRIVVLGVTNPRVIVRQAEMPAMPEEDLAAALRFEAADLIPIPMEDAQLDFQVIDQFAGPEGEPRLRLLLAAAQREMLEAHLRAATDAGLRVGRVDPMALALVRALGRSGPDILGEEPAAEAIVCIGAGVTTVVVQDAGVPRFARVLPEGAGAATEAIATALSVDEEAAEDLKRRAGDGANPLAETTLATVVERLVGEIANSIEFYVSQESGSPPARIVLTGGGSLTRGLAERLAAVTGLPVEPPRAGVAYRLEADLSPEDQERAATNLASVVGLALAAVPPGAGMRRVNLLPAAVTAVREERRQATIAAGIVAGAAVLLVGLWLLRGQQVNSQRANARRAQAQAASLQQQLTELSGVTNLDNAISARTAQVKAALAQDIDWSTLMQQVATVIPDDVWLTSFSGQGPAAGAAAVSFQGMGFDHSSVARWLLRVGSLNSVTDLWVPTSTKGTSPSSSGAPLVTFSSTATLTSGAFSNRTNQYIGTQP
ncbi:MAG TPA: type IV pilus assembly protein PilM [Acidimicrobiales bacterium]|nr:type IV pilus assembly protein PilM [Acidimicrobiales bacterium]